MEKIRPIDGGESTYCDEDNKMGYLLFTPCVSFKLYFFGGTKIKATRGNRKTKVNKLLIKSYKWR